MMRLFPVFFRVPALFSLLAFLLIAAPFAPVFAQGAPAKDAAARAAAKAEIDRTITTIEDDQARAKLLEQLRVLSRANAPAQPTEALGEGFLDGVKENIDEVASKARKAAVALGDASQMLNWLQKEVTHPSFTDKWLPILLNLICVLVGGQLIELLATFLLRRPRRYLYAYVAQNRYRRILPAVGWWLLNLVPIVAFFISAQAIRKLPVIDLAGIADSAAMLITLTYAFSRFVQTSLQLVLMPFHENIRIMPMNTPLATYLYRWSKRILNVVIWGGAIIKALSLLGMPASGSAFAAKALGFLVAISLIALVFKNARIVSDYIRAVLVGGVTRKMMRTVGNRIARIWHLLAALYIIVLYVIWALEVTGGVEYVLTASGLTVLILAVSTLLMEAIEIGVDALFDVIRVKKGGDAAASSASTVARKLAAHSHRHMTLIKNVLLCFVCVASFLCLIQAWGINIFSFIAAGLGQRMMSSFISICVVLIGAAMIWEVVNAMIDRYLSTTDKNGNLIHRSSRAKTLLPLARTALMAAVCVFSALIILSEIGVNITPLLAGAGVIGVAVGFGSQTLVKDFITGVFMLIEDTIAVGDFVTIGSYSGTVESLSIRTLRIRDAAGMIHTLPFSSVTTVSNSSRDYAFYIFDIGVGYRENIDDVLNVLKELGDEIRKDSIFGANVLAPVEIFGLDKFADSAIMVKGRIKTMPGKSALVGREFNRRVKLRFDEEGIEFPYPCQTVYFGVDKDGNASPANIHLIESVGAAPEKTVSLEKSKKEEQPEAKKPPSMGPALPAGKLPEQFSS